MARPEQATGHELQSLSGFVTSSPFSQPPKAAPQQHQPPPPPPPPTAGAMAAATGGPTTPGSSTHAAGAGSNSGSATSRERLPGPAAFAVGSPSGGPGSGIMRRSSGVPMPMSQAPEKTAVGRSGVFDDVYSGGDPFYRRHSVDMGVAIASKSQMSAYSPPRHRYQQPPPHQQPPHLSAAHHGFGPPGRNTSRSGAASPHPLSFDQTASGLSSSGTTGSVSPSHSPSDRGIKRQAQDDFSSHPLGGHYNPKPGNPTADKPYACDQCELTFSRQHNLKSHALTHSTERPFQCPICNTPFRRQHDLKRHMKLHTGEKPHTCTNCGRSFARLDALNRHMRAENFHACNQAAKRARTAVIPKSDDPRLKGASAAYLEQRRASTTSSHPQGAPSTWAHWTHRPSIAADEAMLRRVQERFGGGNGPSSYPQPQQSQPQQQPQSQPQQQQQMLAPYPPTLQQQQSQKQPPPPPASSQQQQQQQQRQQYYPSQMNGIGGSSGKGHPAGGGMSSYAPGSDPRAYMPPQSATRQQHPGQPQSQQQQQAQPRPYAPMSPMALNQPNQPSAKAALRSPIQRSPPEDYAAGSRYQRFGEGPSSGPRSVERGSGPWRQQGPPPENSLGISNGPPPPPPPANLGPPPPPQMRLPPMELAPPRRHSLAVTSHLDRYRAPDASPPPPPQQRRPEQPSEQGPQRMPQQPPPPPSSYTRPPPQQHHMAPLPERLRAGPPQPPPASFLNYTPGNPTFTPPQPNPPALSPHRGPQPAAQQQQQQQTRSPSLAAQQSKHDAAVGATRPLLSTPNPAGSSSAGGSASAEFHPHPANPAAAATNSGSKQPLFSSPLKSVVPHVSDAAVSSEYSSNSLSVRVPDNHDMGDSRRGSVYSSNEHVPDTRRSSIIALTNPQSEADVRAENTELKRRLDEMEYRYLKEMEALKTTVRELEIEKSLLKSLLMERSAHDVSASASPPPSQAGLAHIKQEQPQQYLRSSTGETPVAQAAEFAAHSRTPTPAAAGVGAQQAASSPAQQQQQQSAAASSKQMPTTSAASGNSMPR